MLAEKKHKLRTDIFLTEADQDMIDFILDSGIQRATLFKMAMRAYMNRKEEEKFDERVERLLKKVIAQNGTQMPASVEAVKKSNRVLFTSKKSDVKVDNE